MKTYSIVAALGMALASSTAFAFHCPADMKKIDEAMSKNPKLSSAQAAEVKKYVPTANPCTRPASTRNRWTRSPRR